MIIKPYHINISISVLAILGALTVIFTVLTVGSKSNDASPQPGTIHISSPSANSVVVAGQKIAVVVEPISGVSLQKVSAWVRPVVDTPQTDDTAPFQVQVSIPQDRVGPVTLEAAAIDANGNRLQTSIRLIIESPASAQSIEIVPEELIFDRPAEYDEITVYGTFMDGIRRDLTRSPKTRYMSTNPRVVTVSTDGAVQAVAPGVSSIVITHEGVSGAIHASVGVFELRGDLDGDSDIDRNDLNAVFAALNTQATGPGDPRDLNADDQVSDLDTQTLRSLCSRPNCDPGALAGDLNNDGKVDCADLAIVKASFGKVTGQPGFDFRADTNGDGVGDVQDLAFVSQKLPVGTRCP